MSSAVRSRWYRCIRLTSKISPCHSYPITSYNHRISNELHGLIKVLNQNRHYSAAPLLRDTGGSVDTAESPAVHSSLHAIDMPLIMGVKVGTVKKWSKRIGESIAAGEMICEVTLNDFTVAIDARQSGVLAQILVPTGGSIEAEKPIAAYARDMDEYFSFLDDTRHAVTDAAMGAAVEELRAEHDQPPSAAILMRTLRHLLTDGHISAESDNTKTLLSLARKGDPELLAVFESSYEGANFDPDSFDMKFFISNANAIIEERHAASTDSK